MFIKKLLLLNVVLLLLVNAGVTQTYSNANDGPYVFYTNDSVIIKNITRAKSKVSVISNTYLLADKNKARLNVTFTGREKWNFTTQLKSSLENEPSTFKQPEKMIIFSDIEGEFAGFRELLLANKVIDKTYSWTFGTGHLIICGDLFDRGMNVTEGLWLLYKLEQDAKSKGGYVHVILGNHDIMNLSGDLRYVQKKYGDNAVALGYDYRKLFDQDTELGRWLRTKNIIEKIGDNLFLHAGISPEINQLKLSVDKINQLSRPFYDKTLTEEVTENKELASLLSSETSPLWYRGYFAKPTITQQQIDETLQLYKVSKVIVGHTIMQTNVAAYFQNSIIGVDVDQHNFVHEGALFENGQWYNINTSGRKRPLNSF